MPPEDKKRNKINYGELEQWLGRYYGDYISNMGGVNQLGSDEDILQAMDMSAYFNRMSIAVKQLRQTE
jgi:hypothetical protein